MEGLGGRSRDLCTHEIAKAAGLEGHAITKVNLLPATRNEILMDNPLAI